MMFSRAFRLMTLNGFDIKIDPSWLLIAALITWSLSAQYFPRAFPDQVSSTYLVMAIIAMLGFFASLLLHELAHSVVARRFGVGIKSITLFLFGGVAELRDEPPSASAEMQIALAGPATSLALAAAFSAASGMTAGLGLGEPVAQVFQYLSTINLILALFNLLPAFPLDGGRVLRAVIWQRTGDLLKATETAAKSGSALAYVLIGIGLLAVLNGFLVGGLWQILLGSFLLVAARMSYQQQLQKTVFSGRTVADAMTPDPITVSPDMTLSQVINQVVLRHRVSFLPVVENEVLLGKIDGEVLGRIDRENWNSTKVDDVFVELNGDKSLTPDTSISTVLELIGSTDQRKFLVTEGRRLVGVITLADLTRYMSLVRLLDQSGKMP